MNEAERQEREKLAANFRKEHNIKDSDSHSSDHFLVEIMRIAAENGTLLADDRNQAFTQLFMGKFRNVFADETKDFALAYNFALHPLDEIQKDLEELGITTTQKVKKSIQKDGQTIEVTEIEQVPIQFEVTILKDFINEWLRKRVPANRKRVQEFIDLITGQGMRELMRLPPNAGQEGSPRLQMGRPF